MTTNDEAKRLLERFAELASSAEGSDSDYLVRMITEKANDLVDRVGHRRTTTLEFVLTY